MSLPTPTKRPTPAEYQVLFVVSSLFFLALGVTGITLGLTAAAEQPNTAHDAIVAGVGSIGVSLIIATGFLIARRFTR